ncbi:unnamed protein product [Rodentolepis nana]|uniref:PX domain-containing protein n=1 Tax=Rodentolepis nana TaxID=102285 RepID=A0A0R3TLC9_RODNA|nr:unnamed protein product [Rodentolepis nana]
MRNCTSTRIYLYNNSSHPPSKKADMCSFSKKMFTFLTQKLQPFSHHLEGFGLLQFPKIDGSRSLSERRQVFTAISDHLAPAEVSPTFS